MKRAKKERVALTRAEAEVLASIAEMTLDASGLAYCDWMEVNAKSRRTLTRAYNKVNAAYKVLKGEG